MPRDRYELGPALGGGEGSTTYLATQVDTGERCVVKTLSVGGVVRDAGRAHSFDPDDFTKLVELFEREARVLAHLDHPAIPRFIDHFTETVEGDTRLYTVQEYVEGQTLQALVEGGRHFTEAEARDICRQVAGILQYLHGRSPPLIHRDIKPTNVILDDAGSVHLVDFGSVRNAIGGDGLDGKTIVGTYGYMPIEQYEARAVPQSDFYALGMTLLFVLSHKEPPRLPRRGMTLDFRPHVSVSEAFASVLERMIEAAPEDRHDSADELLEHLSGAPPQGAAPVAAVPNRAALVVGLMVLMLGGTLTGVLLQPESDSGIGSGIPLISDRMPGPVSPTEGVLRIDLDRDFRYRPQGFPMGRSVGQTALPALAPVPHEDLRTPSGWADYRVLYGYFPLGNGPDARVGFALVNDRREWSLYVDANNNEDLTDDGPPLFNEGSGTVLAGTATVGVEILDGRGDVIVRPYRLWVWFGDEAANGTIRGRFYSMHHYLGTVRLGGESYAATAFEARDHDGLYRDSGVCIDLDADEECQEAAELFFDGEVVALDGVGVALSLVHP